MESGEDLDILRGKIDEIDMEILSLIKKRFDLVEKVSDYKKLHHLSVFQPEREREILHALVSKGETLGLSKEFIVELFDRIFAESKKIQG